VLVDIGAALAAEIPVHQMRALGLSPGVEVAVRIDPERVGWL
jgi:antitoxin component of MazEF toxin-antitoxin module